ncbi:hypothetical protein [Streptomyces sp. NPDC002132]|uniref:hypothetical protein n=1 Tax=unclassified Streptomyces TaxID=2593676 RepID=UPI00331BFD2F
MSEEPRTRIVTHEADGRRVIAVLHRTDDSDRLSDAEIVAHFDEWKRSGRHLRVVDDE